MSRIGKQPIAIPDKVTVTVADGRITVKGPKGELSEAINPLVKIAVADNAVTVSVAKPDVKSERSLWGTFGALVQNMVTGVTDGFEKRLEIKGVGYGWQVSGKKVTVKAGFSHPVEVQLPDGVEAKVDEGVLVISGASKQLVGEVAAGIRKIRLTEPYKGTGIKYVDEVLRRKAGKQAAGGEA
jgi:large subunit ribosomal protein L6